MATARHTSSAVIDILKSEITWMENVITYAIFRTFEEEWVWLVKQRA